MAAISVDRTLQKPQEYASDGTDAIGFVTFWGNSPALNLLQDEQAASFGPLAIGVVASGKYDEEGLRRDRCAEMSAEDGDEAEDAEDGGEKPPTGPEDQPYLGQPLANGGARDPTRKLLAPLPDDADAPVNILITGGSDIRHVLKTVAKRRVSSTPRRKLRFFLHDSRHEVLARHVLFLQIMNNTSIPVRERMEIWLSLYGNTLVREKDNLYVEDIAKELVEMMTENSNHPLAEVVDLNHMKYKDRDILQEVYRGWLEGVPFDIEALRDQRCRGYYRERFDHRKNLMDADYQTHIKARAGIINWFHYKEFCFTGVAYETRLGSYSVPNKTLASYTEAMDAKKGTTIQVRGFWGDIINSPYHAFSTTTNPADRPRLFKISGAQYRHTETDVAEFNVTGFLSEMETGQPYNLPPERPEEDVFPYASPMDDLRKVQIEEVSEKSPEQEPSSGSGSRGRRQKKQKEWPPLSPGFENIEIVLLAGQLTEVLKKPKYKGLFQRAFVGGMAILPFLEETGLTKPGGDAPFTANSNPKIRKPPSVEAPDAFGSRRGDSTFAEAMAPGAQVVVETLKYQAHFDGISRLSFRHRAAQAGHLAGWRLADEKHAVPRLEADMKERVANDIEKDASDFLRFVVAA
eukprot:TRINITY_DN80294_c0_g1_i1.p1 TRINITY_DN80294_c0_g1~~TRINITY_DN80294_c0_g1_i1.p1  ORF type:complete len:632 (-),score=176.89 TRINITY_DN80294_c0_g1_i1:253-2148(-)